MNIILKLFLTFLKIGAFSFGGGYAMLPLIEEEVVRLNGWLTEVEFLDIIGISQATPGPIAINSATFVGFKTGGYLGSITASVGVVTVSFGLVLLASHFMEKFKDSKILSAAIKGMRPTLVALIVSAAFSAARTAYLPLSIKPIIIGLITLWLLFFTKVHPILIIVISAIMGFVAYGVLPSI